MANGDRLHPGDAVPTDTCTQVGNFPHGLLANPDALELEEGAFESSMCLNNRKQDYIDAFDANGLIVCNEDDFAKLHSPYIVNLKKKDDEEPQQDDYGIDNFVVMYDGGGSYQLGTYCALGYKSDSWRRSHLQSSINCPCGGSCDGWYFMYRNNAAAGGTTFDLENGPGLTQRYYQPGLMGSCYTNSNFFCQAVVSYSVANINAEDTADVIITATVNLVASCDLGNITWTDTKTSHRGSPALRFASGTHQKTWYVPGTSIPLTLTVGFGVKVEVVWGIGSHEYEFFDPNQEAQGPIPWC